MLYTFTVTESQLTRVTDYLDSQWQWPGPYDRYIWAEQRSLIDDHVVVTVECDEKTATLLYIMISQ